MAPAGASTLAPGRRSGRLMSTPCTSDARAAASSWAWRPGPQPTSSTRMAGLEAERVDEEVDLLARALGERVAEVGGAEVVGDRLEPVVGLRHPTASPFVRSTRRRARRDPLGHSARRRVRWRRSVAITTTRPGASDDVPGGELEHIEARRLAARCDAARRVGGRGRCSGSGARSTSATTRCGLPDGVDADRCARRRNVRLRPRLRQAGAADERARKPAFELGRGRTGRPARPPCSAAPWRPRPASNAASRSSQEAFGRPAVASALADGGRQLSLAAPSRPRSTIVSAPLVSRKPAGGRTRSTALE